MGRLADTILIDSINNQLIYDALVRMKTNLEESQLQIPQPDENDGPVAEQLLALGEEIAKLNDAMSVLLENSAEFVRNADDLFRIADQNSADALLQNITQANGR
jgi:hypothetical protein